MFQKKQKPELSIEFAYHQEVSRWFVLRFLWIILAVWPMAILGFWFGLLSFVHFWHMLLLGERSEPIWRRQIASIRFLAAWQAYLHFFIDTRPAFWVSY